VASIMTVPSVGAGTKPWELWTPDERVMLAVQLQVLHNIPEAS